MKADRQEHPGGAEIILQYAGKDATEEYDVSVPGSCSVLCRDCVFLEVCWAAAAASPNQLAESPHSLLR